MAFDIIGAGEFQEGANGVWAADEALGVEADTKSLNKSLMRAEFRSEYLNKVWSDDIACFGTDEDVTERSLKGKTEPHGRFVNTFSALEFELNIAQRVDIKLGFKVEMNSGVKLDVGE